MPAPSAPTPPWLAAYATGAAEAVACGLALLDGDEVTTEAAGDDASAVVLRVHAEPPRAVRALRWTASTGWSYSVDPSWRDAPRWFPLPVERDADPVTLAEVVAGADRAASSALTAG